MPALDIHEIMKNLPHRYPFLLIDRILDYEPEERVRALKNVTINEPFFQGHFPGNPVMPGVLIVEAMAQAGGVLAFLSADPGKRYHVYFTGLDEVRFRRPVRPGDQLIFELTKLRRRGLMWRFRGEAYVDDKLVCEGVLMATLVEAE
ncbi:MAG: 3-hydroxyacyl-[acyl-carrier-protein] dehydratase FabZ [Zetaproteobacteria bacterium]|nr:MAG: 3-hydroxyacyl-[acyl-carrier-protein] dehydratase FabZ [Zetaproteobacteria bacterium]